MDLLEFCVGRLNKFVSACPKAPAQDMYQTTDDETNQEFADVGTHGTQ